MAHRSPVHCIGAPRASPGAALAAVMAGHFLFFPPLISIFNYGKRIKRAQGLAGVPLAERINPTLAFPFGILIIPICFTTDTSPRTRSARCGHPG